MTTEERTKKIVALCGRDPSALMPLTLEFIAAEIVEAEAIAFARGCETKATCVCLPGAGM